MLFHTLIVIRHLPDKEANLEKTVDQLQFIKQSSYESLSTLIASNLSIYHVYFIYFFFHFSLDPHLPLELTKNKLKQIMGRNGYGPKWYGPK